MNNHKSPLPRRHSDQLSRADAWRHVTIWILLGVAALFLVVFTAVVDSMTQRGELRGAHQNVSNSLNLHEELSAKGIEAMGLLFLSSNKLVGR